MDGLHAAIKCFDLFFKSTVERPRVIMKRRNNNTIICNSSSKYAITHVTKDNHIEL